jgi:hypothetical protein
MVPAASRRVSRAPRYSGTRVRVRSAFAYVAITPFGRLFQVVWLAAGLVTLWLYADARPTTPNPPENSDKWQVMSGKPDSSRSLFTCHSSQLLGRLGLGCSAFARRYWRNRCCFLFLQVLRWFTSLGWLAPAYGFSGPYPGFAGMGFPIRKSPDQRVLPSPRGLSQVTTSFIAVWRQGIHRTPLVA